ncbi:MAG: hypothetical protein K2K67_06735 [Treponemataceae bacterium]|nr:hypothetical protein [Treponemataceae bacterium]
MKKIVGAVLAAGLLASAATADIGFSYKGSNYFTPSGGNLGYNHGDRKDCMSVTFTNAAGGVVVDFDVEETALAEDEYYGWLNFGLPVGSLQVTAGVWKGRYVNRIRADQGDLDSEDFELYKPGVINGTAGKDSDNLTGGNIGVVAAWTLADKLPGVLIAKLGLFKSGWNPDAKSADGDVVVNAGFTGELAYRQDGLVNVNFAVRSLTKNSYSFGLWASPLMVDKLQLTVGGTVATVKAYNLDGTDKYKNVWGDRGVEWGIDLRARYKVTDSFSLTTMNNISSGYHAKLVDGTIDGKDAKVVAHEDNVLILWNMLNATYSIADNLTTALTIQSVCEGFDSDHEADCKGFDITVSPSLAIKATERAAVTTSLRAVFKEVNFTNDWKDVIGGVNFTIPVIFTYSY